MSSKIFDGCPDEPSASLYRDEHPHVQCEAANLPTDRDHLEVQTDVWVWI